MPGRVVLVYAAIHKAVLRRGSIVGALVESHQGGYYDQHQTLRRTYRHESLADPFAMSGMEQKFARRRPGQRHASTGTLACRAYDLGQDKAIRARARFEGTAIGQVIEKMQAASHPLKPAVVSTGESFVASERYSYKPNEAASAAELNLLQQRDSILANEYGQLPAEFRDAIRQEAIDVVVGELVRARRARHTANVLAYVAELERMPRYRLLDVHAVQMPF